MLKCKCSINGLLHHEAGLGKKDAWTAITCLSGTVRVLRMHSPHCCKIKCVLKNTCLACALIGVEDVSGLSSVEEVSGLAAVSLSL